MSPDKSGDNNPLLDEWDTARQVISDADEHLHDLRKYGFSFVTALLTTESFLLPSKSESSIAVGLPDNIKLAVIGVTLVLIIALQIMDRNYQVLQEAAAKRALVLENTLNIELTGTISVRFKQARVRYFYFAVYGLLIFGVGVLGWFALASLYQKIIIFILSYFTFFIIFVIFKLQLPFGPGDWTVDQLSLSPGDQIGITFTNLCPTGLGEQLEEPQENSVYFPAGQLIWEIRNEEDESIVIYREKAYGNGFTLTNGNSYLWRYRFPVDTPEGVYEINRAVPVPISKREAMDALIFGRPEALEGYFVDPPKKLVYPKHLSSHDLLDIIFRGEKIWKKYHMAPLPQNITLKKQVSSKSNSSPK